MHTYTCWLVDGHSSAWLLTRSQTSQKCSPKEVQEKQKDQTGSRAHPDPMQQKEKTKTVHLCVTHADSSLWSHHKWRPNRSREGNDTSAKCSPRKKHSKKRRARQRAGLIPVHGRSRQQTKRECARCVWTFIYLCTIHEHLKRLSYGKLSCTWTCLKSKHDIPAAYDKEE